jgi:cyclophilin family peptidyl-prolyl cis-trans isomerase
MPRLFFVGLALLLASPFSWATVQVTMETNFGLIVLELNEEKAPKSVENFLHYARDGFYEGTIFHRVIPNFMIQGGGFSADYRKKPTRAPIVNEAKNGLKNVRGSIAMARTSDPHSATAQFFINVKDNAFLDYPGQDGWGFTVFGRVTEGMEIVDKISQVPTGAGGPFLKDAPQTPVIIEKVTVIEAPASSTDSKQGE